MKLNGADDDSSASDDDDYDEEIDSDSDEEDMFEGKGTDSGMKEAKEEQKETTKLGFVDDEGTGLVDFDCTLGMVEYPRKEQNPNTNFTQALRELSQSSPELMSMIISQIDPESKKEIHALF
jgi:hypothetical protein